jgi:cytochrome b561
MRRSERSVRYYYVFIKVTKLMKNRNRERNVKETMSWVVVVVIVVVVVVAVAHYVVMRKP